MQIEQGIPSATDVAVDWSSYPLFDALRDRRSRRFGMGMKLGDPTPFESDRAPVPLTEDERAMLAFAACGITGPALNDLSLGVAEGGGMMAGIFGRTVGSVDAVNTVSLFVTDDDGTYLLRRPHELGSDEIRALVGLAHEGNYVDAYRRSRVRLHDGRARGPAGPPFGVEINRWAANAPGCTSFLPVGEMALPIINVLLELLSSRQRYFILDERAGYRPAGLKPFAARRGGHLDDDVRKGTVVTIEAFERVMAELITIEHGMMLQNLGLACEALGLGGFPMFAALDEPWLRELGFRMSELPLSRAFGMPAPVRLALRAMRRDVPVALPVALDAPDGTPLLRSATPPAFPTMRAAVSAVVERKFGREGLYAGRANEGAWKDPERVATRRGGIDDQAIEATVAYCEYVWNRYGRFPAYLAPYHAVMVFQAHHLDLEFYDRHYQPGVVRDAHRHHFSSALHS